MITVDTLGARSRYAAARWISLSNRARQLQRAQNLFSTSGSPLTKSCEFQCKRKTSVGVQCISKWNRELSTTASCQAAPTRQPKLPSSPARTRFAPSPTGYLHIGGLRTALFSYLLARRTGGRFLLRIEDTDQKRRVPDAEMRIFDDLNWSGIHWDEGPQKGGPNGPYRQSERTKIYQEHAQELLNSNSAYRCFCTPQSAGESGPQMAYVSSGCYQNCASLSSEVSQQRAEGDGEAFTVRLHHPSDAARRVYHDLVYGKIQRLKRSPGTPLAASEGDSGVDASDTILMKSDGTPTYHFANVVDDHLMKITHVIRGLEWMASTPLHYDIYTAFGWEPPQFAHVGLLVDQNKAKLSKRNQDIALDVASMRDEHGVLPDPLNNFLALLGWSNPTDNDVMDLDDLVQTFDMKFTRGNTMVRMEKLWYLQRQHVAMRCQRALKTRSLHSIVDVVAQITTEVRRAFPDYIYGLEDAAPISTSDGLEPISVADAQTSLWNTVLLADSKSFQNAKQFVERNRYFISVEHYQRPREQAQYNKLGTITAASLREAAYNALNEYALMRTSKELEDKVDAQDLSSGKASDTPKEFLQLSKEHDFHAVLAKQAWAAALNVDRNHSAPFGLADIVIEYTAEEVPELKTLMQPVDIDATARGIVEARISEMPETLAYLHNKSLSPTRISMVDLDEELVSKALANRYKIFFGALMKFVREKLCGGSPGPSVSVVMAILGHAECMKRLKTELAG